MEDMRSNAAFLNMVFEFLDIPDHMYQGSLTVEKRNDRKYEVEFRNVSFQYPGSQEYALKDVNIKFEIGKKLAVVGMNGSGKTTFIKLLCRLYDPTEGEILLNGIDIRKYNYREYMTIFPWFSRISNCFPCLLERMWQPEQIMTENWLQKPLKKPDLSSVLPKCPMAFLPVYTRSTPNPE